MSAKHVPVKTPPPFYSGGNLPLMGPHPIARIMYKGTFDFHGLYKFIINWLKDREYHVEQEDYVFKIPTIFGKEEEFKLGGWRKVTAYYKYVIKVYIHSFDIREVEIIEKGKKKKRYKGRILIEFSGDIQTDYQGIFKESKFTHDLKKFLDRFVFRTKLINEWSVEIYWGVLNLEARVKEFLNMTGKGQVR